MTAKTGAGIASYLTHISLEKVRMASRPQKAQFTAFDAVDE